MLVTITFEVAEEYRDPAHDTGLTEAGYDLLREALMQIADGIESGPEQVR